MALLEQPIDPYRPLTPDEGKHVLATGLWEEDPALRLVLQDVLRAENFESMKQWVMQWPQATALYQSPMGRAYWEGTQTERANIPFFTVANAVNALVPQVLNGLFYENPPFMAQPRPGTRAQAARATSALIAYQLEEINVREELRLGIVNTLLFGSGIWKWGWETFTRKRTMYERKRQPLTLKSPLSAAGAPDIEIPASDDDIEEVVVEEYVDRPTFEHIVNLRHVMVDPGLQVPDIRKAKYVIHRMYLTWNDLEKLRERPGFKIPPREELMMLFFPPKEPVEAAPAENQIKNPLWDARAEARYEETTADPFNEPLEVLERWDNDRYIVVLQKKLVICNDENPYGKIPFLSCGWWDVPEAFWSIGFAKTIGPEQRLQQGITNLWLDNASLNLNGVFVRVRGKNVPTQPIRIAPGKIVDVDDKDGFKPLDRLPAVPEAEKHLALSAARAEQISGANEITTQGLAGSGGHSNLARSSAGAQLLGSGAGSRAADFVDKITNQVLIPFLYECHEMNRSGLLPLDTVRYILNDELQHEFFKDNGDVVELLNARVKFSVLAGAKMQARRNMAQALPIMIQFLTNQQTENQLAIEGKKVSTSEVLRMLFEVSDWKNMNDVILPMTEEDQKRWQMMQQSTQTAAKAQAQSKLQNQAFNEKQQLVDQENIARAGREILRHDLEQAGGMESVTGEPGGPGFGSNA